MDTSSASKINNVKYLLPMRTNDKNLYEIVLSQTTHYIDVIREKLRHQKDKLISRAHITYQLNGIIKKFIYIKCMSTPNRIQEQKIM